MRQPDVGTMLETDFGHGPVEQPRCILREEEACCAETEDPEEPGATDGAIVHRAKL